MTNLEIWLLAISLAMDCFSVSITSGIILRRVCWKTFITLGFFFGLFQALMPLIGWFATNHFHSLIERFDHWIAFSILLFLGVRMIIDSFKDEDDVVLNPRSPKVMFTLAIATSIDALAVGVSFSCAGIKSVQALCYPLLVIGLVSFLFTIAGLFVGVFCGRRFARSLRAELWGGIILILIGVRVLCEHLNLI